MHRANVLICEWNPNSCASLLSTYVRVNIMCAARGNSGALNQGRDVRLNTGTKPRPLLGDHLLRPAFTRFEIYGCSLEHPKIKESRRLHGIGWQPSVCFADFVGHRM